MKEFVKSIRWLPWKSTKTKEGVWLIFFKTLLFIGILLALFIAMDALLAVTHNFGGLL